MVSTPFLSVPPRGYGGTERVVSYLTEELVQRGHDVTLFATGDSVTSADLVSFCPRPSSEGHDMVIHLMKTFEAIQYGGFDIIHNHFDPFCGMAGVSKANMLTTLHNYGGAFFDAYPNANYVAISDRQRELCSARGVNVVTHIYNGVQVERFSYSTKKGAYLAFLGGLIPRKGCHLAIEVAHKTGIPLKIAGPPIRMDYFKGVIEPHVDGKLIEYVGELEHKEKNILLRDAMATLFPVIWEEPFGLVMVESLACGTPVIAFNRGSVPEIIVHNETGIIVDDVAGMVDAVSRIDQVDRQWCRRYSASHFDFKQMVSKYEDLYRLYV